MEYAPALAPEPAPLRIGLESGARKPTEPARWQLGISYDDTRIAHLGAGYPAEDCIDPEGALDPGTLEKVVPDDTLGESAFAPYTLWLGKRCSTLGRRTREFYAPLLRNQLLAQSSHLLEEIFSTGVIAITDTESYTFAELGMPNRPLESAEATVIAGGPFGVVSGIAAVVEGLAACLGSERGMIHVPHQLLPYLDYYDQIIRNPSDGRFITLKSHDHTVIAGTGYAGNGPDGQPDEGSLWIYGTSPVEVRLEAEIEVLPGSDMDAVDVRQNFIEYRAERLALASWDLTCHVAVPIDVTDPGPVVTS